MSNYLKYWHSFVLMLKFGGGRKANYIKKHHIFGNVGENCSIQSWRLPIYPKLVYIHNNVIVATDVRFVVHDAIFVMLNKLYNDVHFAEQIGCIEIMNNVFIGSGTRILYNVRIGNKVIIGAGSLVNKDIPDNSVYAGVPAKYICSFDELVEKYRHYSNEFFRRFDCQSKTPPSEDVFQQLYCEFCASRSEKDH